MLCCYSPLRKQKLRQTLVRRALYGLKRCSPHLVLEVGRLLARPRGSVSMQRDLLGGGGDAVVLRVSCGPPV